MTIPKQFTHTCLNTRYVDREFYISTLLKRNDTVKQHLLGFYITWFHDSNNHRNCFQKLLFPEIQAVHLKVHSTKDNCVAVNVNKFCFGQLGENKRLARTTISVIFNCPHIARATKQLQYKLSLLTTARFH